MLITHTAQEGLLMDVGSGFVAQLAGNLSIGEATLLYCVATIKTVHDHAAIDLKWDPFSWFPNVRGSMIMMLMIVFNYSVMSVKVSYNSRIRLLLVAAF